MKCSECPYIERTPRKFGETIHCNLEPTHMDVTYHYEHNNENMLCPFICESCRFPGVNYTKYEI